MSRLEINEGGFTLTSESGELVGSVLWPEVATIVAVQRQNMEPDELCLDFETDSGTVTVSEFDQGFEDLAGALIANLDLENPNWFEEAIRPAIQIKPVLVYDREAGY